MNVETEITTGASKLITAAQRTSKSEPFLAVAQLLLAAACLALKTDMSKDHLCEGFVLALGETYNREGGR